ncbi:MAG: hypothetical protein ACYC35_01945 [Pirellulales bacterium]
MRKALLLILGTCLASAIVGCSSISPPNWFHPGPASYQQAQAQRFDPYPENETGPPVVGSRPLEYQQPRAEAGRARWLPWNWGR